jgi:nitrile hydratase accessory protein
LILPDPVKLTKYLDSLPIPGEIEGPIFSEPWQAQAFALAVHLSGQGYFTWDEWVSAFSAELTRASDSGEPDDGSRYYHHWLRTLEQIVSTKGLTDPAMLQVRKEEWVYAYLHTAHGQPVELQKRL